MTCPIKLAPSLCAGLVLGAAAGSVQATGFDLPDQDAFAGARGMAFVATADNPSAIYYNPAGITQLSGHNVRSGFYGLYLGTTYRPAAGGSYDNQNQLHAVPQFFYTFSPDTLPLAFGLGVYSPFGLSSKWPQDSGFRTVAMEGSLTYMTANPVVAWKVLPTLSIAGGVMASYCEMELEQGLTPIPNNDLFRFRGHDSDVGFNLGLRWELHPKLVLGATYRSETTMNLEGHTTTAVNTPVPPAFPAAFALQQDASARFPFPQKTVVGLSYRPTPSWNIEFNADWTDWSRLKSVTLNQSILPAQTLVFDWQSSFYYEWGATRYLGNGWAVSAGYIYNQNSVPDEHYSPLVFDMDRHFLSVGAGFKGRRFTCDAAYQFGYGPARTVSGSVPSAWGQTADGRYDFMSHALFLMLGWKF
jgi:long-chain fatty acid transport protein